MQFAEGHPSGNSRFWKYNEEQLNEIPMPIDFWIAFFSFKCGLIEPSGDINNEIISIDEVKPVLQKLWKMIGLESTIPPIFLDPSIWKISGDNCAINDCNTCFLGFIGYDCPRISKIHRVSYKKNGKIYHLFWSNEPSISKSLPDNFKEEFRKRK